MPPANWDDSRICYEELNMQVKHDSYYVLATSFTDAFNLFAYNGNFAVNSETLVLTFRRTSSDSGSWTIAAIKRPISRISGSFMPRVVTAGVPMRSPEATKGLF